MSEENFKKLMKSASQKMMFLIRLTFFVFGVVAVSCRVLDKKSAPGDVSDFDQGHHNSRNSLDWAGVYTGLLPCADCEEIKTLLKLNQNLTCRRSRIYEGKSEEVFESEGKFFWDSTGNLIQLEGGDIETPSRFAVGENKLTQLNTEGNLIEGDLATMYELDKIESGITEKYWKLLEVYNTAVTWEEGFDREPHMILKRDDNRINGNASCNGFSGNYELKEENLIGISLLASTRKMCSDMEVERNMLKALEEASYYDVMGDSLLLFSDKGILIAKFEAVYLR